jgi:hypothetical protein
VNVDALLNENDQDTTPPLPTLPGHEPGKAPPPPPKVDPANLPPLPELADLPSDPNGPPDMDDILALPEGEEMDLSFLEEEEVDPVKEFEQASKPKAAAGSITLGFQPTETKLSLTGKQQLGSLVQQMKQSPNLRLQITAYAGRHRRASRGCTPYLAFPGTLREKPPAGARH